MDLALLIVAALAIIAFGVYLHRKDESSAASDFPAEDPAGAPDKRADN